MLFASVSTTSRRFRDQCGRVVRADATISLFLLLNAACVSDSTCVLAFCRRYSESLDFEPFLCLIFRDLGRRSNNSLVKALRVDQGRSLQDVVRGGQNYSVRTAGVNLEKSRSSGSAGGSLFGGLLPSRLLRMWKLESRTQKINIRVPKFSNKKE